MKQLTIDDVLELAIANTPGQRWVLINFPYPGSPSRIRCNDGRCPVEAAAATPANNVTDAKDRLTRAGADYWDLYNIIEAADATIYAKQSVRANLLKTLDIQEHVTSS